ncbi:MAG TPA: hypothetical protein VGE97_09420 [Nitrososphaera sp.]|jgi:hypothetical protein
MRIEEDMPGWDCATMGNHYCGSWIMTKGTALVSCVDLAAPFKWAFCTFMWLFTGDLPF